MPPPRTSPRDRLVLAFLIAVALGFIFLAWLHHSIPPEPVYKGRPISYWMALDRFADSRRTMPGDLRSLGPGTVRWLAYTAKHGSFGYQPPKTWLRRQWDMAVQWVRYRRNPDAFPFDAQGGASAMFYLRELGPDAASAVPTLVGIIERADTIDFSENPRASEAARTLAVIGPVALTEFLRLIATQPPKVRDGLIRCLARELRPEKLSAGESTRVLDILIPACQSSDTELRNDVLWGVARHCQHYGFRPAMKPAVAIAVQLTSDRKMMSNEDVHLILGTYGKEASAAIPQLVPLLNDSDSQIANNAACVLSMIDPTDKRVLPRMRLMLSSPDFTYRNLARDSLRRLIGRPERPAKRP